MDLEINLEITSEKFFETLEINFNHNYVADFYWSKTMTDYIYDVKLGWFGYNLHNKFFKTKTHTKTPVIGFGNNQWGGKFFG